MGRKERRIRKKLEKIQLENSIKSKTDIIVSCSGSLPKQRIPDIRAISRFGSLPKQRIPDIRAISHIQTG